MRALRFGASIELVDAGAATRVRFAPIAGLAVAALLALASFAGIGLPATYARETDAWLGQALGQDWVDLLLAVPVLLGASILAWRGARHASLVLAGALAYSAYELAIYAFCVHFNAMFLVYVAGLGLSLYGLASLAPALFRAHPRSWYAEPAPRRAAGGLLAGTAIFFALLWLADIVPALLRGTPSPALAETGLFTNPVHVIDLAILLPAMLVVGISLWRNERLGLLGYAAPLPVAAAILALSAASAVLLVLLLRRIRPGTL